MAKVYEQLIEPIKFKTGDIEYHVGKIPAFYAQRILLKAGGVIKDFNFAELPEDVLLELLSYVAIVNDSGVPIVLDGEEIINVLLGSKTKELIEIELKVVEVNFDFFFNGSLQKTFEPLIRMMVPPQENAN